MNNTPTKISLKDLLGWVLNNSKMSGLRLLSQSLVHMYDDIISNKPLHNILSTGPWYCTEPWMYDAHFSDQYDDQYFLLPSLFSVLTKTLLTSYSTNLVSK